MHTKTGKVEPRREFTMRTILAGALIVLFATTAVGQSALSARSKAAQKPTTLVQLNKKIPEVSFQELPLDQVIDWVQSYTGMNVVVRWQTLTDAGIEKDKPITVNVRNLRLSQVLWMIMQEAGGTDLKLAYRASGNLLILSTEEDLGKEMLTKVYEVSDLLIRPPYFDNAPQIDLTQQQQQGGQGGGGQSIFSGSGGGGNQEEEGGGTDAREGQAGDMAQLITLITQVVQPDSWEINGGVGTITAWRNMIVVRNNILVHQQIGGPITEGTD